MDVGQPILHSWVRNVFGFKQPRLKTCHIRLGSRLDPETAPALVTESPLYVVSTVSFHYIRFGFWTVGLNVFCLDEEMRRVESARPFPTIKTMTTVHFRRFGNGVNVTTAAA